MNVVCIGSGYVGSVTGVAFATLGYSTTVVDIDESKVNLINSGKSPIYEPGLNELIGKNIGRTLCATTSYDVINKADIVIIGVGTPSKSDGTADLKYIRLAAESIGKNLNPNNFTVIIDKSTVPVGTAELVTSTIEEVSGIEKDKGFTVVSNPEFLREGYALEDVFFPDRVVIGTTNIKARKIMKQLYSRLVERENYDQIMNNFYFDFNPNTPQPKYFETDTKSAEMIKYSSNAFLAVKISYINEIARLCDNLGANALDVAKGMGLDSRIGDKFLEVSSGWSGSCFPKDTAEFLATSKNAGEELSIVKAAVDSNKRMHQYCVEKVKNQLGSLKNKTIGILGLTFKPNTDDARKSQASFIISEINKLGGRVKAHDPEGMPMFKSLNSNLDVVYCDAIEDVSVKADALILLTHWDIYKSLKWDEIINSMEFPYLLDTRNFLDRDSLESKGFIYQGIGTGTGKRGLISEPRTLVTI